jgi:DNA polymerase-3 subunit gamma/tau
LSISLYRKYRPRTFREVVGQDTAIGVLRFSYAERKLGHAYMFSGPRGCGKTTAARLLAKIVNCLNPTGDGEPCCECASCVAVSSGSHMDVMEIDGASNRGIDQIRELKSHVGLASFMGGAKVYILDEVHMLTMEAFNALLKTLEEPPPSVMFIFATTEPHKVPVTIRSRCQHIPFHRISTENMAAQLRLIASAEGVSATDSALWEISRSADGALRDAISLFEQAVAISKGDLSAASVRALFGGGSRAEMERWATLVREKPDEASSSLKETLDLGVSPERFLDGLFPLLRDMWTFSLWGERAFDGAALSEDERDFLRHEVPNWRPDVLRRAAMSCAALFPRARMGLRNDVFSGLLLFEILNAFEEPASAPATRAEPTPPRAAAPRPQPRSEPVARKAPHAQPAALPPKPHTDEPSGPPPQLGNEALSRLAADDLPMAAALIDVKVLMKDNSLKLDFSAATKAAEVALTSARARAALDLLFGAAADGKPGEPVGDGGHEAPYAPPATMDAPPSSAEAISARLGADILMSRRLDSDDTDTGDIEDDQF